MINFKWISILKMIKLDIRNQESNILDELLHLTKNQVKSRIYYPGFDEWFKLRFMPSYLLGERDVVSLRDKRYGTLVGFCLLSTGTEKKICNLSPLIDGVGLTQALLDSCCLYFKDDFIIDVPLNQETSKLHDKLQYLGFNEYNDAPSQDGVSQITYIKSSNISWI